MLYYVRGKLALNEGNIAVIDCGGVGYSLTVSASTSQSLARQDNSDEYKLLTYLAVREDGIELFGFYSKEELQLFKMLISVSGVGPKAAMSILSTASVGDIVRAIVSGNQKTICSAQGIGAKTAARIILELKDKLSNSAEFVFGTSTATTDIPNTAPKGTDTKDAENALAVLGYSRGEINAVLRTIDTANLPLEDIIKQALAKFMKK